MTENYASNEIYDFVTAMQDSVIMKRVACRKVLTLLNYVYDAILTLYTHRI